MFHHKAVRVIADQIFFTTEQVYYIKSNQRVSRVAFINTVALITILMRYATRQSDKKKSMIRLL